MKNKIPFLDLKSQYQTIKGVIDSAIQDVINESAFIGGRHVEEFKDTFRKLYGVNHVVPLANGTDAIYIAMKMLGIGPGDEVITTATTWISTAETITQTGATPVFVDIDDYYTIDISSIEKVITTKTKAIIPVHLYGQMCDMEGLSNLAEKYNLEIIEDCAQSHFSSLNGIKAGLWGKCGTFSFYPGKNLGAFGDAGAIITNDEEFAEQCRIYASHGAPFKHHHIMEGINSRLDGIQAAVLNVKCKFILDWTSARISVANEYIERLGDVSEIDLPKIRINSVHSFHVFAIRTSRRDDLKVFLEENGVSCQIHYPLALPYMPAYSRHHQPKELFPNARYHHETELSLPIYPEMTSDQVEFVCSLIIKFFGE